MGSLEGRTSPSRPGHCLLGLAVLLAGCAAPPPRGPLRLDPRPVSFESESVDEPPDVAFVTSALARRRTLSCVGTTLGEVVSFLGDVAAVDVVLSRRADPSTLITLVARDAPLGDLLREVGRQTGLDVHVLGPRVVLARPPTGPVGVEALPVPDLLRVWSPEALVDEVVREAARDDAWDEAVSIRVLGDDLVAEQTPYWQDRVRVAVEALRRRGRSLVEVQISFLDATEASLAEVGVTLPAPLGGGVWRMPEVQAAVLDRDRARAVGDRLPDAPLRANLTSGQRGTFSADAGGPKDSIDIRPGALDDPAGVLVSVRTERRRRALRPWAEDAFGSFTLPRDGAAVLRYGRAGDWSFALIRVRVVVTPVR